MLAPEWVKHFEVISVSLNESLDLCTNSDKAGKLLLLSS